MKIKKVLWGIGAGFLFTVLVGTSLLYFVFPLEFREFGQKRELQQKGVLFKRGATKETESLAWFEVDRCEAGKPCLCTILTHGLGDSSLSFRKWLESAAEKSPKNVRWMAPDWPGYGSSLKPATSEGYQFKNIAKLYQQALTPGCSEVISLGNSLGAWLALETLLATPTEIKKTWVGLAPEPLKPLSAETLHDWESVTVERLKEFQSKAYKNPREISERLWKHYAERQNKLPNLIYLNQNREPLIWTPDLTSAINAQIWIGDSDQIVPLAETSLWYVIFPTAVEKTFANCGHLPQKECAADSFDTLLRLVSETLPKT